MTNVTNIFGGTRQTPDCEMLEAILNTSVGLTFTVDPYAIRDCIMRLMHVRTSMLMPYVALTANRLMSTVEFEQLPEAVVSCTVLEFDDNEVSILFAYGTRGDTGKPLMVHHVSAFIDRDLVTLPAVNTATNLIYKMKLFKTVSDSPYRWSNYKAIVDTFLKPCSYITTPMEAELFTMEDSISTPSHTGVSYDITYPTILDGTPNVIFRNKLLVAPEIYTNTQVRIRY